MKMKVLLLPFLILGMIGSAGMVVPLTTGAVFGAFSYLCSPSYKQELYKLIEKARNELAVATEELEIAKLAYKNNMYYSKVERAAIERYKIAPLEEKKKKAEECVSSLLSSWWNCQHGQVYA